MLVFVLQSTQVEERSMWSDLAKFGPPPLGLGLLSAALMCGRLLSARFRSRTSIPINRPFIHRIRTAPVAAGSTV